MEDWPSEARSCRLLLDMGSAPTAPWEAIDGRGLCCAANPTRGGRQPNDSLWVVLVAVRAQGTLFCGGEGDRARTPVDRLSQSLDRISRGEPVPEDAGVAGR